MAEFVLVADPSLMSEYRGFPLLDFLPCSPSNILTKTIYRYMIRPPVPSVAGRALRAPYALRKIEAALVLRHPPEQVVVAHPDHLEHFLDDSTKVIGIHTMDPAGLGPLTMMFTNGRTGTSIAEDVFTTFMSSVDRVRRERAPKAKVVVGGPGTWELWYMQEIVDRLGIDYVVQGEVEDVVADLLEMLHHDFIDNRFFYGFQTFDQTFFKKWEPDPEERFVTRAHGSRQFPKLEEIPDIMGASLKGLVEVMRGCGIGCDFCEVTLRPTRYYPPEKVQREILVNQKFGVNNAWLQSDEIFIYGHSRNFEPNQDALIDLFGAVMATGISHTNPTHGRISIPAGFPELIEKLSKVARAGPNNCLGIQAGIESASDRLAEKHMPLKTMPLRIGPDGSWAEIIRDGTVNLNRYYWRPAFTLQIGQAEETPEDNWMTVGLINDLSNAGLEFTATVLYNVPLGLIKTKRTFGYNIYEQLDEAQMATIYASFRHLVRMAYRRSYSLTTGDQLSRIFVAGTIALGSSLVAGWLERIFAKKGFRTERAKRYSLNLFN